MRKAVRAAVPILAGVTILSSATVAVAEPAQTQPTRELETTVAAVIEQVDTDEADFITEQRNHTAQLDNLGNPQAEPMALPVVPVIMRCLTGISINAYEISRLIPAATAGDWGAVAAIVGESAAACIRGR